VQICELGFLEPLEYIFGVTLHQEVETTAVSQCFPTFRGSPPRRISLSKGGIEATIREYHYIA